MATGVSIGGTASFYVNGALVELAGSMKVDVGGIIRTPVVGPSGPTGNFTEKWEAPEMEMECLDNPSLSLTALRATTNASVQLALRNGKTYILRGAFQVDKIILDAAAGTFPFKLSGVACEEITA